MAYPEIYTHHPVYPALVTLRDIIYENCESTRMVFCMPWAYEDGMTWLEGWTDTYVDMQIHIYDNILQYSDEIGFEISPVGWAWKTALEENYFPLHYLHLSDWNHPSLKGSYLMACVIFSTIFQESSVGNTYYADLPEEEANYFQTVASNTVLDSLDLWNITSIDEFLIPNNFHLLRNYPNPFNPSTIIEFSIHEKSQITLEIFDIKGRLIATLANNEYNIGNYTVSWFGKDHNNKKVSSGIYFYRLSTEKFSITKKMLLIK